MRTRRVFSDGTIDTARAAVDLYRREYTRTPHVLIIHPDDCDERAEDLHLFGCVILRSPLVEPGHVRACGVADDGIATVE